MDEEPTGNQVLAEALLGARSDVLEALAAPQKPESVFSSDKKLAKRRRSPREVREAREWLLRELEQMSKLAMGNATDHVWAMAQLWGSPPVPTQAGYSLARSAIESCALALWLLAPGEPLEVRLARVAMLCRMDVFEEHSLRGTYRSGPYDADVVACERRLQAAGVALRRDRNGKILSATCGEMESEAWKADRAVSGLLGGEVGGTIYRLLSGTTHGRLWRLRQSSVMGFDDEGAFMTLTFEPSVAVATARCAVDALYKAGTACIVHFGRPLFPTEAAAEATKRFDALDRSLKEQGHVPLEGAAG